MIESENRCIMEGELFKTIHVPGQALNLPEMKKLYKEHLNRKKSNATAVGDVTQETRNIG